MRQFLFICFATAALFIAAGCRPELESFRPFEGTFHQCSILGIVVDELGQPIEGAYIEYMGKTKVTDQNGVYQLKDVAVDTKHNVVKITKPGYFDGSREFAIHKSAKISLRNMLLKKEFNYTFDGNTGGTISDFGVTITFPASAVVVESTGASYTGQVKVAMKYLDPTKKETFDQMPGALSGLAANDKIEVLTTYGMVAVEMQSTGGEQLQIKSGQVAEMSAIVPDDLLDNAPASLPLWYYDETLGYWKEEGNATLEGNKYIGTVSHFTYWNYDSSLPAVQVCGTVVDQNGNPLGSLGVGFYPLDSYTGGHGYTNADGTFCGLVPANLPLNQYIYAYYDNCGGVLGDSVTQVGPFMTDITLPDIIITITPTLEVTISGSLQNCNGDLVQNGYLLVNGGINGQNQPVPVTNGAFSFSMTLCPNQPGVTITGVDLNNLLQSLPFVVTGFGDIAVGTLDVCAEVLDYISVECAALGLSEVLLTPVLYSGADDTTTINHSGGASFEFLTIDFLDTTPGANVNIGTFEVNNAQTYILGPTGTGYYSLTSAGSSGSVMITQGGSVSGDVIKGTYSVVLTYSANGSLQTFTGEFSITIP
jgi:hypothetical protein